MYQQGALGDSTSFYFKNMSRYHEANNRLLTDRHARWIKPLALRQSMDENLATAAVRAIECLTTIPVETIRVTAGNGWLHLAGTVRSTPERILIEQIARNLPGATGVTDSIKITAIPPDANGGYARAFTTALGCG